MTAVKAEKLDVPLGVMLVCLGIGQIYLSFTLWRDVKYLLPAGEVLTLLDHLFYLIRTVLGLLGVASGLGLCRRAAWAWSIVRWAGGACLAGPILDLYHVGPVYVGAIANSIATGRPQGSLWLVGCLGLYVFGALVWVAVSGVLLLREPREGRRRLRTLVGITASFAAMILLESLLILINRSQP